MAEFRWILLGLGLVLIVGIWWWGARRSAQAPGDAELRETTVKDPLRPEPAVQDLGPTMDAQEWDRSPFEPISIKTTDFEPVPIFNEPMMADGGAPHEPHFADDAETVPNTDTGPVMAPTLSKVLPAQSKPSEEAPAAVSSAPAVPPASAPSSDSSERIAGGARKPNTSEKQKIVTVRVSAPLDTRWPGAALLTAFEANGLAYGRYQVFHRRHIDGRSLFSVASLVEPGTFDVAQMPAQQFKGVTLFAVLPGPVDPLLTVDEMLAAARGLASALPGSLVQDASGVLLAPENVAALRDDVAQFHSTLPAA